MALQAESKNSANQKVRKLYRARSPVVIVIAS